MKHTDNFVRRCIKAHMAAFEEWPHGPMKEVWTDEDGYLCIHYEGSPTYWHYKEKDGGIIWW